MRGRWATDDDRDFETVGERELGRIGQRQLVAVHEHPDGRVVRAVEPMHSASGRVPLLEELAERVVLAGRRLRVDHSGDIVGVER